MCLASTIETHGRFSLNFVFNKVMNCRSRYAIVQSKTQIFHVKARNKKYQVFKRNPYCMLCGLEGQYFLLQRQIEVGPNSGHFNMFADVDGKPILFTKDHILPKSRGGPNDMYNLCTLCEPCNQSKADNVVEIKSAEPQYSKIEKLIEVTQALHNARRTLKYLLNEFECGDPHSPFPKVSKMELIDQIEVAHQIIRLYKTEKSYNDFS